MKLKSRIRRRKINKNVQLPSDLSPLLHRLYVSRGVYSAKELKRNITYMLPWEGLPDIKKSVNMLYKAFHENLKIVVVGDFDADGATSVALSLLSLRVLGYNNIDYIIPNRFEDGYGLSPEIIKKARIIGAQMIMTVDNGIASHMGVKLANKFKLPVLITDHHCPSNILPNAEAIVNPNLPNCDFPSKALSGVGVVFYVMLALRNFLKNKGWFQKKNLNVPSLAKYLDLVALGTIADAVPLDFNNRILTWQGLSRMRAGICCPGIQALLEISNCNSEQLAANDLSFSLGPRLNAAGRLQDMSLGVELLLCTDVIKAKILAHKLDILNQARKKIEKKMQNQALILCESLQSNNKYLPTGLAIYCPNWHQGVVGILASRIKEQFHRPVIAFASSGNKILKGSGRSIQGINIYNILEQLNARYPGLILKFGGHKMAVGLLIEENKFKEFQCYFDKLITEQINPYVLQNEIISDGLLMPNEMTIEVAKMLLNAGPWGHMFPEPVFDGHFHLLHQKLIKNTHLKVIIKPIGGGPILNGIVFSVDKTSWPNHNIHKVELAYKLNINRFNYHQNLQATIIGIWPL